MPIFKDGAEMMASLSETYGAEIAGMVYEEFEKDWQKIQTNIIDRTRQNAAAVHARPHYAVEGLGQHTMEIDGDSWAYWANREPGCWQDANFRKEYLRDNPEARVPYTPKKTIVPVIKPATNYTRL